MYGFKEWWEKHLAVFSYDVTEVDAWLIWQAASERAAEIAEEPGWKCEDVCPDDCTNAKYIAEKIRMD
jgi:hypothetical protein